MAWFDRQVTNLELKKTHVYCHSFLSTAALSWVGSLLSVSLLPFLISVPSSYLLWDRDLLLQYADTILRSIVSLSKKMSTEHCDEVFPKLQYQNKAWLLVDFCFLSQKLHLPPSCVQWEHLLHNASSLPNTEEVLLQKSSSWNWPKVEKWPENRPRTDTQITLSPKVFLLKETQLVTATANTSIKVTKIKTQIT